MTPLNEIVAVYVNELHEFGCPYCGFQNGYLAFSGFDALVWQCAGKDCGKLCVALERGMEKSPIGFGRGSEKPVYPGVQKHPRFGTPAHGNSEGSFI